MAGKSLNSLFPPPLNRHILCVKFNYLHKHILFSYSFYYSGLFQLQMIETQLKLAKTVN